MKSLPVVCVVIAAILNSACADDSEFTRQWHQWRGPTANGAATADAHPPVKWSDSQNVAWVCDLPGQGSSTPVIWNDQVFVLSAEATETPGTVSMAASDARTQPPAFVHRFLVTSLDHNTGKVRWQKIAAEQVPHEGKHETHTYAAGSPTTDGKQLYVSFGSRGLFCYSLDGELRWSIDPGDMRTRFGWGEAVTPALAGDRLIVNWDQEENSAVFAIDTETGKELWRKERPQEVTSWNTPLITEYKGRTLAVLNGTGKARAYDVSNGEVVWECGGQTTNAIPSAVPFEDFVVCMSGYRGAAAFAIPLDSSGDVTGSTTIRWSHTSGTPYVPSASVSGDRLYFTAGTTDMMTVLDLRTGKPLAERQRLSGPGNMYASPLVAGGHVYFVGREGTSVVIKDEAPFETVSTNTLDGIFDASPVAVGSQLFLRSWNRVYCLKEKSSVGR